MGRGFERAATGAPALLALIASMERVMIQADPTLLERARRAARQRGVTFPQLVRDALEHELTTRSEPPRQLSCAGVISTDGRARERVYEPDEWR
jgi:hypothetical protein